MPALTTEAGNLVTGLLNVLGLGRSNSVFKSKLAGVAIEFICERMHAAGRVENSTLRGMGVGAVLVHYLECTVPKPAAGNCKIHNELIQVAARGLMLLAESGFKVEFQPEGPNFTEVTIEGCSNSALDGTFSVTGTVVAAVNNTTLDLEFTETSGSSLRCGVNAATYTDTIKGEMEGGGGLMAEAGS
jgi:hypothetical protein